MPQFRSPIHPFVDAIYGDWVAALTRNEFYFHDLEEEILRDLSPNEAFEAINDLVGFMLTAQGRDARFWCASLLLRLAYRSNTTEIPAGLSKNWTSVMDSIAGRDDVSRQIAEWYRHK